MGQQDAAIWETQARAGRRHRAASVAAAQPVGWLLRQRRDLLASTALGASAVLLLACPAVAQPAPGARPQGGAVVAGSASISQTAARTNVAQTSQRAAVDWRSFDVGSGHTVAFQQPNASSVTLNRVTGPDPSQIAGRIQANGQVVLVNGSGVVFHAGSQVDAQSLVVSAANVTNRNFMAGRMVFDQPGKADARISNAGTITVGATGLAALVAPQVANSGVINARMGRVVLAGAEAHTVDLYGDGLMSVDVTRQVTRAPNGGTALVTNTGVIQADGGTIQLTARAADGIVQNLVSAGGRLQANTAGGKPGAIVVAGVGGSITVEGAVRADGIAPGAQGGTVVLAATGTVAVGPAARVSANGRGGGGTVAVGTTLARARAQSGGVPADSARAVQVAAGARISADGRGTGSGGQVALLSTDNTVVAGRLTARGGRQGGDGGLVEVSGGKGLQITGTVDTTAPAGRTGTLTIDPADLTISDAVADTYKSLPLSGPPDNTALPTDGSQTISAATFNGFSSNVNLVASNSILLTGNTPLRPVGALTGVQDVKLSAPAITVGVGLSGKSVTLAGTTINVNAPVASDMALTLAGNSISLGANVNAGTTLTLTTGAISQAGGVLTAPVLTGSATGPVTLLGASNAIGSLGPFSAAGQTVRVATGGNMSLAGAVSAGTLDLRVTGTLTQNAGAPIAAALLTGSAATATLGASNNIASLGPFTAGTGFQLTNAATTVSGNVTVGTGTLSLTSSTLAAGGGLLRAPRIELQVDRVTTTGAIIDGATGLVAVAPRTAGTAIAVGDALPAAASGLALTNAQLQSLAPTGVTTLQIGRTSTAPDASGIILDGTLALGRPGQTLALYAAGDVSQTPFSKLTAGAVTGSAGGSFLLQGGATAGSPYNTVNAIDSVAGVSAVGSIAVASGTDLSVTAPVNLSGNAGMIALTSRGQLTLNSVVGSGTEALALQGGGGIQQASPVNVASLQGGAGGILPGTVVAKLDNPVNSIGALGSFTALQGDVTVFAQAVTVLPGATVSGRNVSLRSLAGDLAVNGAVGATAVNGGAVDAGAGTATLAATGVITISGTVNGEQAVIIMPAPGGVTVASTGVLSAGRTTTPAVPGDLNVGGQLRVNGGTVSADTVEASGGVVQTGGTVTARSSLSASPFTYNGGALASGSSVSLLVNGLGVGDSIRSGGDVTITGGASQFISQGEVAARGNLSLTAPGGFFQPAGRLVARGTVSIDAGAGLVVQAGAGTVAAGGAITLQGTGAGLVTLDGRLAAGGNLTVSQPNADIRFNVARLSGTAPGSATGIPALGTEVAVGPTGAQTVRIDGKAIELAQPFGTGTLELNSSGATFQDAPISAAVIRGRAGYAADGTPTAGGAGLFLQNAGNQIGGIGAYQVSGSVGLVTTSPGFAVVGQVAAGGPTLGITAPSIQLSGGSFNLGLVAGGVVQPLPANLAAKSAVLLRTDRLDLQAGTVNISAPGGTVGIATLTPGLPIAIGTAPAPGPTLVLSAPGLAQIKVQGGSGPQEIRIGSLGDTLQAGDAPSRITINAPLNLTGSAATLRLISGGDIQESGTGAILIGKAGTPGSVTGQAGGAAVLDAAGNSFDALAGFTAGAGLRVATGASAGAGRTGLTVTGGVSSGTGDLSLASVGLTIGGTAVGGTLQLGTSLVPATLSAGTGTLTLTVSGGNGAATAIVQAPGTTLTAGTLTGSATNPVGGAAYDVVLNGGAGNNIGTLGSFVVRTGAGPYVPAGAFQLSDLGAGGLVVAGPMAAGAVAITARNLSVPGTVGGTSVTLTATEGGLTSTGVIGAQGSVTLVAPSQIQVFGGSISAPTVTAASGLGISGGQVFGGTVTAGPTAITSGLLHATSLQAGTVGFSNGDLYAGNSLSVSLASVTAGTVATQGDLTAGAGGLSTTTAFRAGGSIALTAVGDVQLAGGSLAAAGNVTVTAKGGAIGQDAASTIAAGGTVLLQGTGGGDRAVQGVLLGGQVQVVQPGVNLTLTPSALGGAATVQVGALSNTFHAPGLDGSAAVSAYAPSVTPGAARPVQLRADGLTLTVGTVAADQVVLHSGGNTVATGVVTAGTLSGTAGYAPVGVDAAGLPVYPLSAGTAGTGSATFGLVNNVQRLGDYQVRSGFTLTDAPGAAGLTIAGTVRSGLAPDPLVAPSASAAPVTITLTGTPGNPPGTLFIGDAAAPNTVLAGSSVVLGTTGAIVQAPSSSIVANQFSATGDSVVLQGTNSIASLGALTAANGITLNNQGAALTLTAPVNAGAGVLTLNVGDVQQTAAGVVTAGVLAGSSTGRVDLTGATNVIGALGGFTAPGGFALNDGATALRITGPLNAGTGEVNLAAGSLQQAPAGVITAGTLRGSIAGATDLGGAVNAVGALGAFASGGDFTFNNGLTPLTLTGPLNAGVNTVSLTAGSLGQTVDGAVTAGRLLLGVPGQTNLTAASNAVRILGPISSNGDFGLNAGTSALTLSGPVNIGGNKLTLQAGSLSQTAQGVVTAGQLTGGTAGATNLGTAVNSIGSLGTYASGGSFTLNNGTNGLVLAGPLNAGTNQVTLTSGTLQQVAGATVTAGVLTGNVTGLASLNAGNTVQALGAFTTRGSFTFDNGLTGLTLTGAINTGGNVASLSAAFLQQNAAGTITASQLSGTIAGAADLSTAANTVKVLGNFSAGGEVRFNNGATDLSLGTIFVGRNALALSGGTLTQQTTGTITTGSLSGTAIGTATFVGVANDIRQLGAFSSGGDFRLATGGDLGVTGLVQAGARTVTLRVAGDLVVASGGSLAGGTVDLNGASVKERGGTIAAGVLNVTTRRLDASSSGNLIQVLGPVDAPDGVTVQNGRSLVTIGDLRSAFGPVSLGVTGDLTVNAAVAAGGGVSLQASGAMTLAPGSAVAGPSVTLAAGGPAALAGNVAGGPVTVRAGGVQVLGAISGGTITLDAGAGRFGLSGAIAGTSVSVTAGGPATLDGVVSATGPVTVRANGLSVNGTVSNGGTAGLDAGSGDLVASGSVGAGGALVLQAGGAAVLNGRMTAGTSLFVGAGTGATLAGSVAAPLLSVAAPAIRLSGGTILTGGGPLPTGTRQAALPVAGTAGTGAFFQTRGFVQSGTTTFAGLPGSSGTTVRVTLSGNGSITLGTFAARSSTLILDLGNGSASGGPFQVASLYVIYQPGGGTADLQGQVGGLSGNAAASAATVFPFPSRNFRINSCAVASVNCIVLTPQTVPVGNPLKELSLSFFREQDDESQLVVPNVTDQGL